MTDPFVSRIERDFAPGSRLSLNLAGYVCREEQVALSAEIAAAMASGEQLLSEAETGTGKTLAYLVPALRTTAKVAISTHTRALQDQLMFRDLPAVQQALGIRRKVALLKGRANYLCPLRLERKLSERNLELWARQPLLRVAEWAEKSVDGDLAGLPFDVFEKGIGPFVTATAEQCSGNKCPHFSDCPLMQARAKAQEAEIVVTNHSLLLADAALKMGEFGQILPAFDCYILDEAHSLPQLAGQHFGIQLSRLKLINWLNDMQAALDSLGDEPVLKGEIATLGRTLLEAWPVQPLSGVLNAWRPLVAKAESRVERSEEMQRLADRAEQMAVEMELIQQPRPGFVAWSEGDGEQLRYQMAPIETGPVLADNLWGREASFILLSATLRLSGSFAHAQNRLGMDRARTTFHPSPFDYRTQALTYLPRHLPEQYSPQGIAALEAEIETLLRASRGRAFVLFTSYATMNRIAPNLARKLPWPVLEQGKSGSKDALLKQFRDDTHSILCGTRSFWEGVDVPGEALSLVIIDKMPFAPPNDPLLTARIRHCEEQGGNGFRDIQLPEAIAVLRQGVGRLIRTDSDRGVMAILDSRLHHKTYGHEVVRNLPNAPLTAKIERVQHFFSAE